MTETLVHFIPLQVLTLSSEDMNTAVFNSIPGQGVIYMVIVRDPVLNTSASYVPVHTYACSFASALDGCQTLGELLYSSHGAECEASHLDTALHVAKKAGRREV